MAPRGRMSIAARMVVGCRYQPGPMDPHAWFEACVGGRWHPIDATQVGTHGDCVAVGQDRDAADIAVYSPFGPPVNAHTQTIEVAQIRR